MEPDSTQELADDALPAPGRTHQQPRVQEPIETQSLTGMGGNSVVTSAVAVAHWRPFLACFIAYANARYARRSSTESRVDQCIADHKAFYRACMAGDYLLIAAVALIVVTALAANLWKVFLT